MPLDPRARLRKLRGDKRGFVAVMVSAMVIPIFMGSAAMAVDISQWYAEIGDMQKAADMAALSGVAHLPTSPSSAYSTAAQVAADNGFRAGDGTTTAVTARVGAKPEQLVVTISATIPNAFGALIGTPETTLRKSATAEMNEPFEVGSPCNLLGNEPAAGVEGGGPYANATCPGGSKPRVWAEAAGPDTDKAWGNQRDPRHCDSGRTSGCAGSSNTDQGASGHFYKIRVHSPGQLRVQLFDPVLVHVGSTCEAIDPTWAFTNKANPWTRDAKRRYAGKRVAEDKGGVPLCTGDNDYGQPKRTNSNTATTFALRAPGTAPDPMTGPIVCAKQFDGFSGDVTKLAREGQKGYKQQVARFWRQWGDLCSINAQAGDYYLQVRTNVKKGSNLVSGMNSFADQGAKWAGKNGYAVRATVNGGGGGVTIGAANTLALSLNIAGDATFHMARIGSQHAGRLVTFEMFDIGDVEAGRVGTVRLLAPVESSGFNGSTIQSCRGGGVVNRSLPNCMLPNVTVGTFNGKSQRFDVQFPSNYRCDDTSPTGCWFRVRMRFDGDGRVFDATSWTVTPAASPIRLVK
jgi:Flp pilus assembly protein TadG